MKKDVVFNELSIEPLAGDKTEAVKRVRQFLETFKTLRDKGFKGIRYDRFFPDIHLCKDYTFQDFCKEPQSRLLKDLLISSRRYPFIDDDSKEEDQYIESRFFLDKEENKLECYGLAAAYLYSTSAIGFLSEQFWDQVEFKLIIEKEEVNEAWIVCLSRKEHLESEEFCRWLEEQQEVCLAASLQTVDKKPISLRADHGKDLLEAFSKKLIKSPYVEGVVNSMPFNPKMKDCIKKLKPNGLIEFVLTWTDKGLGVVIQTTGKNLKETEAIAAILKEKFCKK